MKLSNTKKDRKFKVKFVYSDSPDAQLNLEDVFRYILRLNFKKDTPIKLADEEIQS